MVRASKSVSGGPDSESAEEKRRRTERLASFYQSPKEEPRAGSSGSGGPRALGLTDVDPVFRSEFNTVGYLAVGFSLIALLLIAILFFRPPKPEAELQALREAQVQTREVLEQLSGRVAALSRRAERSRRGDLARNLRITYVTLDELKKAASPSVAAEAEALQSRIEALLGEVERGPRTGTPP